MPRKSSASNLLVRLGLVITILLGVFGFVPGGGALAAPLDTPGAGVPAPVAPHVDVPGEMAVFRLIAPAVNENSVLGLAGLLEGLNQGQVVEGETYAGTTRLALVPAAPTEAVDSYIEQFSASGGFFAYSPTQAFAETARGPFDPTNARLLACQFLLWNELFPWDDVPPNATNCQDPASLPYQVITSNLTGMTAGANGAMQPQETVETAVVVQVPLGIYQSDYFIPLRGPGGHLSLLFTSTDLQGQEPSLDGDVPGLAAIASPWYQRGRDTLGYYQTISETAAIAQFFNLIGDPQANPGIPELAYFVEDAAIPQQVMLPMWSFPNATTVVDGEVVNLREVRFPAVIGFLPAVQITAPGDGSVFDPGETLAFSGEITAGSPPYHYRWTLPDGTLLDEGDSADGLVGFSTSDLGPTGRPGCLPR